MRVKIKLIFVPREILNPPGPGFKPSDILVLSLMLYQLSFLVSDYKTIRYQIN